jgi:hypothetical protein
MFAALATIAVTLNNQPFYDDSPRHGRQWTTVTVK